ncbi:MAG: 4-hydroxythreonine-4-phosphate dehydrogenase PdxA, partial [Woeseiaceae bacterium]|nr:4-hydroxythreonine-4-phosphate dehydrogenase PdxA [Woeseiaceae bacterium]
MTTRPLVVTAGDPAGIGPDLCIAVAESAAPADFVVISDADVLEARAALLGSDVRVSRIDADEPGTASANELRVIHRPFPAPVVCGQPDSANAGTLLDGLRDAVAGCRGGHYGALVTAPLSKRTIIEAGIPFTGHTEFLAAETGAPLPVMLLVAAYMRVALATTHLPLRDVPDALTQDGLRQVLTILHRDLCDRFAIRNPRILVCGLNPHAGEGGHLGREDDDIIRPVVAALSADGMDLVGPLPADTAFTPVAGP